MQLNNIIAAVQFAVWKLSGQAIAVDGIWGPESQTTYMTLNDDIRSQLVEAVEHFGYDPSFMDAVAKSDVIDALYNASVSTGESFDFLANVAYIESALRPSAVNGSHKGLFQMSRGAWEDADSYVRGRDLPDHSEYAANVFNAEANALYGAAYLALTRARLSNILDREVTDVDVYLGHQQGVGGYTSLLRGEAVPERNLVNNPPQDGLGVTTNVNDFVDRWQNVVKRKLSKAVVA